MILSAMLKDGISPRQISIDVPIIQNQFQITPYVDYRWARPRVFHDAYTYPMAEADDAKKDFATLVNYANYSSRPNLIDKFKDGLMKSIDAHISRYGRILFCDLLMYVDCLAYVCYASGIMTETQIRSDYAAWAKYIVDYRKSSVMCSTKWGAKDYFGSENESDLNSCFKTDVE